MTGTSYTRRGFLSLSAAAVAAAAGDAAAAPAAPAAPAEPAESAAPPAACPVCEDERQYVNWKGQVWLTREELAKRHKLVWRDDLGLTGIGLEPEREAEILAAWHGR